jgi:hypothetical protein
VETVALVLVLGAARAGVNAVLSLELLGKLVNIDRLNVASDGVLHLDAVARVLESNPLYAVLVLPDNKWCGSRNWSRSSIGVDVRSARGSWWASSVHVWSDWWNLRRCLWWASES